nr:homoserine dehydrogenase [Psychromicrobium sp. YIM S02556]
MSTANIAKNSLKIALLGCGNVGAEVARILLDDAAMLTRRSGTDLELIGIAVRTVDAPRTVELPAELFTTDASGLIARADLVIELMGGIEPARTLIREAITQGASVVTGNKALLAVHGPELYQLASENAVQLSYEAAVAGAIPILRPIRDSLAGDTITRVLGIVNGTTNYILDQMDTTGADFAAALAEAQRLGYAEADPTADVQGHDAAAKAAILASLSFHTDVALDQVHCEGIAEITSADIEAARESGLVIKLLAIAERLQDEEGERINVRVHPTLLPRSHPLAAVHGAFNAVFVEAENAGELMFYGQGAGGRPTASAVMGDVVSAARRIVLGGPGRTETASGHLPAADIKTVRTSYSVGLEVSDEAGVLAQIAGIFAHHGASIETLRQTLRPVSDPASDTQPSAELRIVTHRASESALAATVAEVRALPVVKAVTSVLRVEGI